MDRSHLDRTPGAGAVPDPRDEKAPDRRELIKLGLAALAGAGVSALAPRRAYAAVGGAFTLGYNNDAEGNGTRIFTNRQGAALIVANTSSGAPLRLDPNAATGAPASATGNLGELYVDSMGVFYKCVAGGGPGTWARMNSTVLLDAPKRVVDTRTGLGGVEGPLVTGTVYTFPSFFSFAGIPTQAIGLVGNLTMVAPTGKKLTGGAWMAIVPAAYANRTDTPAGYPGVSTLNAGVGTNAVANQFTVKVGTGTYDNRISIVKSGTMGLHAVVDIAGYIV
jgi:hypothetical protein